MGGIWGSREFFNDALIEIAGYKAGVVLTDGELLELMREQEDVAAILNPNGPGGEAPTFEHFRRGGRSSPLSVGQYAFAAQRFNHD